MRKINVFVASLLFFFASCGAGEKTLLVTNDSDVARQGEVIEVDIADADEYAVFDNAGKPLQCQTTYDGKLIFQATVDANSEAKYTLKKAERPTLEIVSVGKTYSEWYNNYAWENDKIAFRTYGKDIAKTGSKLYGYDIITKRGERPVLDLLFSTQFDKEYQKIRRDKSKDTKSLTWAISIHLDHGLGMDYYAVGPTLGSGTTALLVDGEIQYPTYFDKCEILDEGGLRSTVRLTLPAVDIAGEQVTEVRTITLDAGSYFNQVDVEYQGLSKANDAVIGIVMHDEGEKQSAGTGFIAYAEPMHDYGWQTYNAIIFDEAMTQETKMFDEITAGAYGHLLAKGTYTPGENFSYHMGAAWNRWGFATPEEWFAHVEEQKAAFDAPLTYTLK